MLYILFLTSQLDVLVCKHPIFPPKKLVRSMFNHPSNSGFIPPVSLQFKFRFLYLLIHRTRQTKHFYILSLYSQIARYYLYFLHITFIQCPQSVLIRLCTKCFPHDTYEVMCTCAQPQKTRRARKKIYDMVGRSEL